MIYPWQEHEKGNISCDICEGNYPIKCVCGGLIHAEFNDISNSSDCIYILCDNCGINFLLKRRKINVR